MVRGMAIRPIVRMGNPGLARAARPVHPDQSAELATLIADMADTMKSAGGVGLAAPQIGVGLRVIVFEVPSGRASADPDDQPRALQALINPAFEILDDTLVSGWEGCLSIPGLIGEVPRYARILYSALDIAGNRIERPAAGFHARVIQHEIDHLDGVLYPERMTNMRRFGFAEELSGSGESSGE